MKQCMNDGFCKTIWQAVTIQYSLVTTTLGSVPDLYKCLHTYHEPVNTESPKNTAYDSSFQFLGK